MPALFTHALVLVADRTAFSLDTATIKAVRDAVQGGVPAILSPGEAAEIPTGANINLESVQAIVAGKPVDAILVPLRYRRKRLLVADMDSTIITGETLDELADKAGLKAEIAAITRRAMNGELDFVEALRRRVAMLRGLPLQALEETWRQMRFTPGAKELVATMRAHGAITALVSGGFTFFTAKVAAALGFQVHRANRLCDDGVALTGQVAEPILEQNAKLETLRQLTKQYALTREQTMAVGDGANDLAMLREAGLGVGFRPKPILAAQISAKLFYADLRALLFAQGYPAAAFAGNE
ncbi:MAG: phosphoserine phosphatase SerB [Acidobacteriia bacterium]|nr:phosphoserine phosphatase SerB [Methyloceanibacter sp.]MBX5472965.1 phosphoserine phosphatase SerB [Acetobacteraceae bacterium]MCL6491937.1 phosphoserine phosphatase SerB [Terriglobia bacterium]